VNASHVLSLSVLQGGSQAFTAGPAELDDVGFYLIAKTIDDVVYDLARFDDENHAYDSVGDLLGALAHNQTGPLIGMFLPDERLGQVSLRDLRLDRELASRNAALDAAADYLSSRVMTAIDGQKAPLGV
jgi:hypothetical protein